MLQQFSERFAKRENFSEVGGGEISASVCSARSLAADLNHADHFFARKNRRADNFLNRFAGIHFRSVFTPSKTVAWRDVAEWLIVEAAFSNRARRKKRGIARQRNEADVSLRFGKLENKGDAASGRRPRMPTSSGIDVEKLRAMRSATEVHAIGGASALAFVVAKERRRGVRGSVTRLMQSSRCEFVTSRQDHGKAPAPSMNRRIACESEAYFVKCQTRVSSYCLGANSFGSPVNGFIHITL